MLSVDEQIDLTESGEQAPKPLPGGATHVRPAIAEPIGDGDSNLGGGNASRRSEGRRSSRCSTHRFVRAPRGRSVTSPPRATPVSTTRLRPRWTLRLQAARVNAGPPSHQPAYLSGSPFEREHRRDLRMQRDCIRLAVARPVDIESLVEVAIASRRRSDRASSDRKTRGPEGANVATAVKSSFDPFGGSRTGPVPSTRDARRTYAEPETAGRGTSWRSTASPSS